MYSERWHVRIGCSWGFALRSDLLYRHVTSMAYCVPLLAIISSTILRLRVLGASGDRVVLAPFLQKCRQMRK